ncbi:F-BAR domain only protein 1-like [Sturnira hondurensis]|nr:F-BAR domain only protein 1-like [Sturnira hondurensis]
MEGLAAPPRRPRSRKVSCPLLGSNGELSHSLSPSPLGSSVPSTALERSSFSSQTGHGISRGPSPVVLGSQDALPVATVFTEYVHAYFRGHSPRFVVLGHSADSERQTGLPGGWAPGFQHGQTSGGFPDLFTIEGPGTLS